MDGTNFAPEEFSDLPIDGSGGHNDGFVVSQEPPYGSESGGVGFSGAVARSYGDVVVIGECLEDFSLLFPRRHAETLFEKPNWVFAGQRPLLSSELSRYLSSRHPHPLPPNSISIYVAISFSVCGIEGLSKREMAGRGAFLSEPRITGITQMGYDAPPPFCRLAPSR